METIPTNSQLHFQRLIFTQGRLVDLQEKEENIQTHKENVGKNVNIEVQ